MLKGNKVLLRPLRETDLPTRLEMVNNPGVQLVTIGMEVDKNTSADLEAWFELVTKDPFSEQWAIDTLSGEFIGDIDLHSINVIKGEAWVSPMIGKLEYLQDASYRKEAVGLIAAYAFREKSVDRLSIDLPDNDTQGIQLLTELGFRQEEEAGSDLLTGVETITMELVPADLVQPS